MLRRSGINFYASGIVLCAHATKVCAGSRVFRTNGASLRSHLASVIFTTKKERVCYVTHIIDLLDRCYFLTRKRNTCAQFTTISNYMNFVIDPLRFDVCEDSGTLISLSPAWRFDNSFLLRTLLSLSIYGFALLSSSG